MRSFETLDLKPFRIRIYKKTGVGWIGDLTSSPLQILLLGEPR